MKLKIETLYLSYVNDFLTLSEFANHYNITPSKASRIIDIGRKINTRKNVLQNLRSFINTQRKACYGLFPNSCVIPIKFIKSQL